MLFSPSCTGIWTCKILFHTYCLQVCCFLARYVMQCKNDSKSHYVQLYMLHWKPLQWKRSMRECWMCVNMYLSDWKCAKYIRCDSIADGDTDRSCKSNEYEMQELATHVDVKTRDLWCCQAFVGCLWVYSPVRILACSYLPLHPVWKKIKNNELNFLMVM